MTSGLNCHEAKAAVDCFLAYNYPETKDLLKTALTLISGLLVLSVTFGDKVVGMRGGPKASRRLLVAAWIAMVAAFIAAGASMALLALAEGSAIYGQPWLGHDYAWLSWISWDFMLACGVLFVLGLILMVAAAASATRADAPGGGAPSTRGLP